MHSLFITSTFFNRDNHYLEFDVSSSYAFLNVTHITQCIHKHNMVLFFMFLNFMEIILNLLYLLETVFIVHYLAYDIFQCALIHIYLSKNSTYLCEYAHSLLIFWLMDIAVVSIILLSEKIFLHFKCSFMFHTFFYENFSILYTEMEWLNYRL